MRIEDEKALAQANEKRDNDMPSSELPLPVIPYVSCSPTTN